MEKDVLVKAEMLNTPLTFLYRKNHFSGVRRVFPDRQ